MSDNEKAGIEERLLAWLETEGHSVEFKAARILSECGFSARQGSHTSNRKDGTPREIDVTGTLTSVSDGFYFRITNVVECKYSKGKPWVSFIAPQHRIANSACAAQTIASDYGRAMMWPLCGDGAINQMQLFESNDRCSFGGRQAFTSGRDLYYDALRSVTGSAFGIAESYNRQEDKDVLLPRLCVLVFPIIVVEGRLFECGLNADGVGTFVREVDHTRIHWQGSELTQLFTTVDIVTLSTFRQFSEKRHKEQLTLIETMQAKHQEFVRFAKTGNIQEISFSNGSTGVSGYPRLFRSIVDHHKDLKK